MSSFSVKLKLKSLVNALFGVQFASPRIINWSNMEFWIILGNNIVTLDHIVPFSSEVSTLILSNVTKGTSEPFKAVF